MSSIIASTIDGAGRGTPRAEMFQATSFATGTETLKDRLAALSSSSDKNEARESSPDDSSKSSAPVDGGKRPGTAIVPTSPTGSSGMILSGEATSIQSTLLANIPKELYVISALGLFLLLYQDVQEAPEANKSIIGLICLTGAAIAVLWFGTKTVKTMF